jgi:hypothetical protein
MTTNKFVLVNATDNVLVCCQTALAGEGINIDGVIVKMTIAISLGHKIARTDLKVADKIIKHGVSIGSMTKDVQRGEHIHMHNMKSDYIPSHTRQHLAGE